ncbi:4-hydroxy-tetrahydrodipicolinate reductase [Acetohalobium arabaticum]|uniref:4-hydroxy-tetrahydrodipicolinate reductase n=1 Tax=Acetohalobium arabaticum (strain ATCC 49924 / DSM 5501 / Z-7288) TaxID=574087 RepID=D9QRE5_ACEAZ|nr:4-hydroxy-tetrahydrodipicolinate reductase [Acetohalobium arabaticum]ADL13086.1 dihydrodipicolinate reductase [Acetohalobium arabaticum DSM 5501]
MTKEVIVNGALGKMGQEVVKLLNRTDGFKLVSAVDKVDIGEDIHKLLGVSAPVVEIESDLAEAISKTEPDAVVDFTTPQVVMENIETGLENGINMVIGTTGITEADIDKIEDWTEEAEAKVIIAPNFAVGAILMMKFSQMAAKYLDQAEIIELHHDQKLDAPSGTAIKTAELINEVQNATEKEVDEIEKIIGARGGEEGNINIHSVRLSGLVAHQEVLFGGVGQTLKIRHDSINRRSFMPGVKLALESLDEVDGVVYGLEKLMEF